MIKIIKSFSPERSYTKCGKKYIDDEICHGRYNIVGWGNYIFFNGRLSCLDGPAYYNSSGHKDYWIFGIRYNEQKYYEIVKNIPLYLWKQIS
jgi:hypothetical protein